MICRHSGTGEKIQRYYNNVLHYEGQAPEECSSEIASRIVANHLATNSMLTIIPLQDWFAIDDTVKRKDIESDSVESCELSVSKWIPGK